ncbi:MAG: nitroreductase family deazaflavin-dependent oxidoreductase [Myxococcales bacterium]|nr:nitroreductase family deazaflavin-dependent oxidoreductase [Myxococcales bacterium]MDH3485297.1 nitroreductase family deazaflavin-dependent oxidoreductase [Myxococcales bacterium]
MASRYKRLRARALKAMFKAHTVLYEASDGRFGASGAGVPMLLLSVTGRKSGKKRSTPLVYFQDGDSYVVVGSDGAAKRDPQWWKNLQVDPSGEIRVGRKKFPMKATLATGTERERLWEIGKTVNPMWAKYQARTQRELPVVVLTPVP